MRWNAIDQTYNILLQYKMKREETFGTLMFFIVLHFKNNFEAF